MRTEFCFCPECKAEGELQIPNAGLVCPNCGSDKIQVLPDLTNKTTSEMFASTDMDSVT